MEPTFEDLLASYVERYPQEVRDLAETFCATTTRLGHHMAAHPPTLTADAKSQALSRGVDLALLAGAVADYSVIEMRAESLHRERNQRR